MNRKERRKRAKQAGASKGSASAASLMAEGLALAQAGEAAKALPIYERALKLDPENTDIHYVMGVLNKQLGAPEKAEQCYQNAVAVQPANFNAWYNLGNVRIELGRLDDAAQAYQKTVALNPGMAVAWNNLGNVLKALGRLDEAEAAYQKSISAEPGNVDALFNLGEVQRSRGALADAVRTFEKVLDLNPNHGATLNNLGSVLRDMKHYDRSADLLRKAVLVSPDLPMGYINLGNTLRARGDYQEAQIHFEKALSLHPENPKALTNYGNLLQDMGLYDKAKARFEQALVYDPQSPEGHYNLGLFDLLCGNYKEGWPHFNKRWGLDDFIRGYPQTNIPLWQGQPLDGRKLLIWDEQGVGDTLLFASLIPDVINRGGDVKIMCDARLIPLFERAFAGVEAVPKTGGSEMMSGETDVDYHVPMGNLGGILRNEPSSFSGQSAFLRSDEPVVAELRNRYRTRPGDILVGIAWHSKGPDSGPRKSVALRDLMPVLEIPGISFVNLQYGDTEQERQQLRAETGVEIYNDKEIDQLKDLDGFASQVKAMDRIVTISNTTAHMAGALGVSASLMLCTTPIWYWGPERADTPWYPSLDLYRQSVAGEWEKVIKSVAEDLKSETAGDTPS